MQCIYKDDGATSVAEYDLKAWNCLPSFKMRSLVIVCAFFAVLYGVQATGAYFRFGFGGGGRKVDPDTRAGESCAPRYVRRCGEPRLVGENVRPADDSGWGIFCKDTHTAGLIVDYFSFTGRTCASLRGLTKWGPTRTNIGGIANGDYAGMGFMWMLIIRTMEQNSEY